MKKFSDKALLNLITLTPFIFYCTILGQIGPWSQVALQEPAMKRLSVFTALFLFVSVLLQNLLLFIWLHRHYHEPDRAYRLKMLIFEAVCVVGVSAFILLM